MPVTLDLTSNDNKPFALLAVPTDSWVSVELPVHEISVKHTQRQPGAGNLLGDMEDRVYIYHGDVAAPVADNTVGPKLILWSGESKSFRGSDIRPNADGKHVIQLRAVGNAVLLQFISGGLNLSGR
jgi:hypothetical protein